MLDCHRLADRAAGRMSNQMSLLDAERVHESEQIPRHLIDGIGNIGTSALPSAAVIVDDHCEPLREGLDLRRPVISDTAESRNQKQRRPVPVSLIVNLDSIYGGFRHEDSPFACSGYHARL